MKQLGIKIVIVLYCSFFSFLNFAEGFGAGTFVKTSTGYELIENLCVGDMVLCFDNEKQLVERPVVCIKKKFFPTYAHVVINGNSINLSLEQKAYNTNQGSWTSIADVRLGDTVLAQLGESCSIEAVELKNIPIDVYLLSIAEYHNFFVSEADICAHNFVAEAIAGISFLFGSGAIEFAGFSFGLATLGSYVGYHWHKKSKHNNVEIMPMAFGGSIRPDGPDDEDEKKRNRDNARENHRPLTNKQARKLAEDMGYREVKSHPCKDTRGKPVFTNGKEYISPDADCHRGGVWKLFDRAGDRVATYNIDLTKVIGK